MIDDLSEKYNEEWKPILYNGIETTYYCSNFSRIKNTKNNKEYFLTPIRMPNGYYVVSLSIDGVVVRDYIHRIIGKCFIDIPNKYKEKGFTFDDLEINHKKGNEKWNNTVYNLEWNTDSENKYHGYDTNLYKKGEQNHLSIYKDQQIREVCKYLEENELSPTKISKLTGVSVQMIYDILYKISWKSISKEYDFSKYRSKNKKYADESISEMHKLLKEKKMSFKDISIKTGIPLKNVYYYNEKYYK